MTHEPWHVADPKNPCEYCLPQTQGGTLDQPDVVDGPPLYVDIPLPEFVAPSNRKHACLVCGCPNNKMPMVFRGTGWCCENHRKEQEDT